MFLHLMLVQRLGLKVMRFFRRLCGIASTRLLVSLSVGMIDIPADENDRHHCEDDRWLLRQFGLGGSHAPQLSLALGRGGARSRWLSDAVKGAKTLPLPALYVQGEVDGVNPPPTSENVGEKFAAPFERTVVPGVGHFPQRKAPEQVGELLAEFLLSVRP